MNYSKKTIDLHNFPFRDVRFPSAEMTVETRSDGSLVVTPVIKLKEYIPNLSVVMSQQAKDRPEQPYLKERDANGEWFAISYAEVFRDSSAVAAWLLKQGIDNSRPVLILSGNSIHHAVFKYGAMAAQIPVCPVSINYSLIGGDYGRLKHVINLLNPAVVFAEHTDRYKAALNSVDFADAVIITANPDILDRPAITMAEILETDITEKVSESIFSIDPDAPAVYMLTSGSTSLPKAVIHTQRMITANLAQVCQVLGETAGWDDQMLDWLPWNHVSGASTKMGVMVSGGTLHIDAGRPMPGEFDTTVKNIKDVPVKFFTNVPAGYAMLADAMDTDPELQNAFFGSLRLALYGGAGLPQALYDRFQKLAIEVTGKKVFFTTGYGATETSSGCMAIYFESEEVGIGLPMPGLTIKLVPENDRYEVRMHGIMVTPGYVGQDSSDLFDDEGFLKIGDYATFIEHNDISRGLKFAGRLAEEFKLANGTWVSGGTLKAGLIQTLSPLISDAVICGLNAEYLAALVWLNRAAAERYFERNLPDTSEDLACDMELRSWVVETLGEYNERNPGSSTRIKRIGFLIEPPSIDGHEISDKGTVNQSVALQRRANDVERLYAEIPDNFVITLD
jgi:feruloyl-CoA synthase